MSPTAKLGCGWMQHSESPAMSSQTTMHVDSQQSRWCVSLFECLWVSDTNIKLNEILDGMITANETHGGINGKKTWTIMKVLAITHLVSTYTKMRGETDPHEYGDENLGTNTYKEVTTWRRSKDNTISYSRRDWEVVENMLFTAINTNINNIHIMDEEKKTDGTGDNEKNMLLMHGGLLQALEEVIQMELCPHKNDWDRDNNQQANESGCNCMLHRTAGSQPYTRLRN